MKTERPSIDPKLQAYYDRELSALERSDIEKRLADDAEARSDLDDIARMTGLLRQVYENPPVSSKSVRVPRSYSPPAIWGGIAVTLVALTIGLSIGILSTHTPPIETMQPLASVTPGEVVQRNVLLNTSSPKLDSFERLLDAAERYLGKQKSGKSASQVEVLVHGSALQWLERGSPAASRVATLENRYHNLTFRACGVAMKLETLDKGVKPTLLPEAEPVDAALEEIVRRVSDGWLYVRG